MNNTEIWTIIGALGIKPYFFAGAWVFSWKDNNGNKIIGTGYSIKEASENFVKRFLDGQIINI